MKLQSVIHESLRAYVESRDFVRCGSSWYCLSSGVTTVLNLQKSTYGRQFYLNVGLWIHQIEEQRFPKVERCHVYGRIEDMAPPQDADFIEQMLDLENELTDQVRRAGIETLLARDIDPILPVQGSLSAVWRLGPVQRLLSSALIRAEAQDLLGTDDQ